MTAMLITLLVGFLAFQNCQKAPHADDLSASSSGTGGAVEAANKTDLGSQKISSIDFFFSEAETITRAGKQYQLLVNKTLSVELATGHFTLSSDTDPTKTNYCLTETLTSELVSILKASQICRAENLAASGRVCTQVYKMPYAQLKTEKESYDLGRATDGCGSNAVDLCGEQVSILQGYIATLKLNYKSFKCP